MLTQEHAQAIVHATAYGASGHKLGKIGQIYVDNHTHAPRWATVHTGFFGNHESFVPLTDAELDGERLLLPFDREQVRSAPELEPEPGGLTPEQERELYRHYGVQARPQRPSVAIDGDAGRTSSFGPATGLAERPETYEDHPEPFPMRTTAQAPASEFTPIAPARPAAPRTEPATPIEPAPRTERAEPAYRAGTGDTPAEKGRRDAEPEPHPWFSARTPG